MTLVMCCRCAKSWCDLDLTFVLAVVPLTFKIFPGFLGNISETIKCRKLIVARDIASGLVVCIIIFSSLINVVIYLLNCPVYLHIYIHFLSL